jgi:hypothetical protein
VYNTIAIEELGVPAVMLTNQNFIIDSKSAASSKGMPGIRILFIPSPSGDKLIEDIETQKNVVADNIISALTKPLTVEEQFPKKKEVEKPARIVFKGNLEDVNRFLYRRGWADGLPVIPPTEEAVTEMLTGTDLPADHLVTELVPRRGKATIEKIAINGVMAGALPTHLALLIAGVQALAEPVSRFDSIHDNLGSWSPFWIINGPIRNDIRVSYGVDAFSPGDIANAAIGRAMGLIIKNIGGIRKGVEEVGVLGNPAKQSLVLGENEEESPWEPLQVERGFKKENSTITLLFPRMLSDTFNSFFSGERTTGAKRILDTMVDAVQKANSGCFVLGSITAKMLSREGWTKEKIKEYISSKVAVPPTSTPVIGSHSSTHQRPSLSPDGIIIIVAGAPSDSIHFLPCERISPSYNFITKKIEPHSFMTKKIELPARWNKLIAKYKDIVPIYSKY